MLKRNSHVTAEQGSRRFGPSPKGLGMEEREQE